jgi:hypothetical protein
MLTTLSFCTTRRTVTKPKTSISPSHIQLANLYSTTGKIFLDPLLPEDARKRLLEEARETARVLRKETKDPVAEYRDKLRAMTTRALPAATATEEGPKEPFVIEAEKKTELLTKSEESHAAEVQNALDSIVAEFISECDEEQAAEIIEKAPSHSHGFVTLPRIEPAKPAVLPPSSQPAVKKSGYCEEKDKEALETFYQQLDETFYRLGKSTTKLASYFGLSNLTIARWLSREDKPAPKRMEQMESVLNRVRIKHDVKVSDIVPASSGF